MAYAPRRPAPAKTPDRRSGDVRALHSAGGLLHDPTRRSHRSSSTSYKKRLLHGASRPEDVGLVTGNRRVNPRAVVLVVVAEILLNRLLHPEAFEFENVSSVVMDEFHNFADQQRGIVRELSLSCCRRTCGSCSSRRPPATPRVRGPAQAARTTANSNSSRAMNAACRYRIAGSRRSTAQRADRADVGRLAQTRFTPALGVRIQPRRMLEHRRATQWAAPDRRRATRAAARRGE